MLGRLGTLPFVGSAAWAARSSAYEEVDGITAPTRIVINPEDSHAYWRLKKLNLE